MSTPLTPNPSLNPWLNQSPNPSPNPSPNLTAVSVTDQFAAFTLNADDSKTTAMNNAIISACAQQKKILANDPKWGSAQGMSMKQRDHRNIVYVEHPK